MSTTLNDTMDAAKNTAMNTMESAKEGTQHAVSSARSTLFDGIRAVNGVVSILRGFGLSDALGWVGLSRRRGPFETLGIFGAGFAAGAIGGVLFAPKSGADTRQFLLDYFKGLEKDAEKGVKEGVKGIETKAEDLAGKAKDAVVSAEKKVEDLAGKAKDNVIATEKKAEDYIGKAKDNVKDTLAAAEKKGEDYTTKGKENNTPGNQRIAGAHH